MTDFSLVQAAKLNKAAIRDAESRVADILALVWKRGGTLGAEIAGKFLSQSDAVEQLTALMRAELLYGLSKDWTRKGMSKEFVDWACITTGKDAVYITRRVRVGAMLADTTLPAIYRQQLKFRSMEELIMLATVWDTGDLRPTKAQWTKLLEQPDPPSLGDEIRRILGRKERTNSLTIFWNSDGTLEAWQDGETEALGFIKRPEPGDKSLRARAVLRLLKGKVKDK